jgi:hypothetical protein
VLGRSVRQFGWEEGKGGRGEQIGRQPAERAGARFVWGGRAVPPPKPSLPSLFVTTGLWFALMDPMALPKCWDVAWRLAAAWGMSDDPTTAAVLLRELLRARRTSSGFLAWALGHIPPAAAQLLLPSCVPGQGIFIPSFVSHGVCCDVQRCEGMRDATEQSLVPNPLTQQEWVFIASMGRWSTAHRACPTAKLPRD